MILLFVMTLETLRESRVFAEVIAEHVVPERETFTLNLKPFLSISGVFTVRVAVLVPE